MDTTDFCLGYPTMDGNEHLGDSSASKPALHIPEPLSMTTANASSSDIVMDIYIKIYLILIIQEVREIYGKIQSNGKKFKIGKNGLIN